MASRKVKIKYLKAYDFKVSLATGVYGGVSGNGLISANFFAERGILPDSETVEVDDKGVQIGQPVAVKDADLIRELQSGILMDINTAKVMIRWLESKIKDYEKIIANKNGNKS